MSKKKKRCLELESQDDKAYVTGKGKHCDRDIKTPGPGREVEPSRTKEKEKEVKKCGREKRQNPGGSKRAS